MTSHIVNQWLAGAYWGWFGIQTIDLPENFRLTNGEFTSNLWENHDKTMGKLAGFGETINHGETQTPQIAGRCHSLNETATFYVVWVSHCSITVASQKHLSDTFDSWLTLLDQQAPQFLVGIPP